MSKEELLKERKKLIEQKKKRIKSLSKEKRRLDRIEMQMTLLSYDMDKCPKCKILKTIHAVDITQIPKKGRYLRIQTTCSPGCEQFNLWEEYRILSEKQIEKLKGKKKADENEEKS